MKILVLIMIIPARVILDESVDRWIEEKFGWDGSLSESGNVVLLFLQSALNAFEVLYNLVGFRSEVGVNLADGSLLSLGLRQQLVGFRQEIIDRTLRSDLRHGEKSRALEKTGERK